MDAAGATRDLPDVPRIARRGRALTWRRRGLRAAVAATVAVGVVAAGQGLDIFSAEPLPPVEQPRPPGLRSLEDSVALTPARYEVSAFEYPFSVRVTGADWFSGVVTPTWVYLARKGIPVHIQRWDSVIRPSGGVARKPVRADLPAWFQEHPGLDVLDQQTTTLSGVDGVRLDVAAKASAARLRSECEGRRCVLVARVSTHGEAVDIAVGERARFYILEMPDGPVVVYWHARASRFEELERRFDGVVGSIRFM
jgi:hypothetical protein